MKIPFFSFVVISIALTNCVSSTTDQRTQQVRGGEQSVDHREGIEYHKNPMATSSSPSDNVVSEDTRWMLSGFIPSHTGTLQKQYLLIEDGKIVAQYERKPQSVSVKAFVDTDDILFPGLIDMYNRVEYSALPEWSLAQGQFHYRRQWLDSPNYLHFLQAQRIPHEKAPERCDILRYGEIMALVGGTTTMLANSNDRNCLLDYGVRNIDFPEDLGVIDGSILVEEGLNDRFLANNLFTATLLPLMKSDNLGYQDAYQMFLDDSGIQAWLDLFQKGPQDLRTALQLTLGTGLDVAPGEPKTAQRWAKTAEAAERALLAASKKMADISQGVPALKDVELWINEFLGLKDRDQFLATAYLVKKGVLLFGRQQKEYVHYFETLWRKNIEYSQKKNLSFAPSLVFLPLAEGSRQHPYAEMQFFMLQMFDIAQPGLVVVHGNRLRLEDYHRMNELRIPLVWTPFSDYRLYGGTIDIVDARNLGVNLVFGSGWAQFGSKNILDQLKVARMHLDRMRVSKDIISDRDLVQMATINAAKALQREHFLGRIAPGYGADILAIKKSPRIEDPFSALINSSQQEIQLVVVKGKPVYGNNSYIKKVSALFPSVSEGIQNVVVAQKPSKLKLPDSNECTMVGQNLFLWPKGSGSKASRNSGGARQIASISKKSRRPLFSCMDISYLNRMQAITESQLNQYRSGDSVPYESKLKLVEDLMENRNYRNNQ